VAGFPPFISKKRKRERKKEEEKRERLVFSANFVNHEVIFLLNN